MTDYSNENRESFFARLNGRVTPSERIKIDAAYMLAKYAHRAQVRKELGPNGDPLRYFEHVRRVALIYIDAVQNPEYSLVAGPQFCEDVCIALLHDTIEDTKEVSGEMIELVFGPEVARRVILLTKTGEPTDKYLARVSSDNRALFIKLCDRLDNVRSLRTKEVGEEFRVKQKIETREKYLSVFEANLHYTNYVVKCMLDELKELVKKS